MDKQIIEIRVKLLKEEIQKLAPKFAKACDEAKKNNAFVILHQDAFGADYQPDEFVLIGKIVKYAGLMGVEIRIIGSNRETLK